MRRPEVDKESREKHFSSLARRYALDAKMLRCRASVHVENKGDIAFWEPVLKHSRPDDRFHFISGSRNEYGQETSGVTQALKYLKYLSKDFFICIDSDYRFLKQERGVDAKHFVLQTYTYSFENHICFAAGLNDVCERITQLPNTKFSFEKFLSDYSRIIYDLFIWHLHFLRFDPSKFSKYEFNKEVNILFHKKRFSIKQNGGYLLDEFGHNVEKRVAYFARKYPDADLEFIRKKGRQLGLTPATTYLFLRGHNVYDMVVSLIREVCKNILYEEVNLHNRKEMVAKLYQKRSSVDVQLLTNIRYGSYEQIKKIEADIKILFS